MAKGLDKLKKRPGSLGAPPAEVPTSNLETPEVDVPAVRTSVEVDPGDLDGRSLRATGRTHQFATRIKEETHKQMKRIVARDGITLGELIEKAVDEYERKKAAR